jgi:hypothetical protein
VKTTRDIVGRPTSTSDKLLSVVRDCKIGESSAPVVSLQRSIRRKREGDFAMKIRHILIASAALAVSPAIAQETAVPQASADCASLQAQFAQAASTASSEQMSAAKAARDEGDKLCSEGKTSEGAAKLQEAISAISQPSQHPTEQPPTEQPPTEQPPIEQPPTEQPPQ